MPEFSFVDFLREDGARIQGCLGADDVDKVCAKVLSRGKRAWSCARSVSKVAWEAMMQERTYLSRMGRQ